MSPQAGGGGGGGEADIYIVSFCVTVSARSHGATATANCVKNRYQMAPYPAMRGSLQQWMFADPVTVNGSYTILCDRYL